MSASEEIAENTAGIRVEIQEGNYLYLQGHKMPYKGIPSIDKIDVANQIKNSLKGFKMPHMALPPYYLFPFATEMHKLVANLTGNKELAEQITFVLEYDQAYRFRLQDLFNETSKERLKNPFEILRLSKIYKKRDIVGGYPNGMTYPKLRFLFWGLTLYATINLVKWRKAIEQSDFINLQPDSNDKYWMSLKYDYNYGG